METELRELEMNQIFLRSAAARFVIETTHWEMQLVVVGRVLQHCTRERARLSCRQPEKK